MPSVRTGAADHRLDRIVSALVPLVLTIASRNRRLIAERGGWPAGAAEACERFEADHPGLRAYWFPENVTPGWERRAGFYAWREGDQPGHNTYRTDGPPIFVHRHEWYGATIQELTLALTTKT